MGVITRHSLLETQDIKESSITGGKVLDHTLGSQHLGTTVGIIVAGTQIKDDVITEVHVLDHTLGSQHLGTTVGIIVAGTQIKDYLITPAKFSELQEHGTIANVRSGEGSYIVFDTGFLGTPDMVISPEASCGPGTFPYIARKASGSAQLRLKGAGTIVCDYIAIGARI